MSRNTTLTLFVFALSLSFYLGLSWTGSPQQMTPNDHVLASQSLVGQDDGDTERMQMKNQIKELEEAMMIFGEQLEMLSQMGIHIDKKDDTTPSSSDSHRKATSSEEIAPATNSALPQQLAFYEQQHVEEDVDPRWSSYAQASIQEILSSDDFSDITVINADCRTSTCKLELEYAGQESIDNFFQDFGGNLDWNHDAYVTIDENTGESVKTTMYITKTETTYEENNSD